MAAKKTPETKVPLPSRSIWNVPDWHDASAYPNPKGLTLTYWRWEFLRRLKAYRDDWTAHAPGTYQYCLSQWAKSEQKGQVLTLDHPQFRATADYLRAKVNPGTEQEREAFKCIRALRKYGLIGGLPNPAIRTPFLLSFDSSFGGMYIGRGEDVEAFIKQDHVLYEFDLTRPLGPQLVKAKQDLLHEQLHRREEKEAWRVHQRLFPLYLRVLDARDCGTLYREIGETLLQKADYGDAIKRANDLHDQALSLQANLSKYF